MIRRTNHSPHTETTLTAIVSSHRAPVGGHVMHVIRAIRANDVDELVCVDLGIHCSPVSDANGSVRIASPQSIVNQSGFWPIYDRTRPIQRFR